MNNVGAGFEGDAGKVEAKLFADLEVHLVVNQPQGDLGDLGGKLLDLNAVKLIHVNLDETVNVETELAGGARGAQHVQL